MKSRALLRYTDYGSNTLSAGLMPWHMISGHKATDFFSPDLPDKWALQVPHTAGSADCIQCADFSDSLFSPHNLASLSTCYDWKKTWSVQTSLSTWVNIGSLASHWAHSENSESSLDAQAILFVLSWCGSVSQTCKFKVLTAAACTCDVVLQS